MKILLPAIALLTVCGFASLPTALAENPASTAEKIRFALKAREKAPIQNLEYPLEVGPLKFNRIVPDRGQVYLDAGKGIRFLVTESKLPDLEKLMAAKTLGELLGILSVSDSKEGLWSAIDEGDPKAYLASMKHEALGQTFRIAYLNPPNIAIVTVQALLPAPVEGMALEDRRIASIAADIKMVSLSGAPPRRKLLPPPLPPALSPSQTIHLRPMESSDPYLFRPVTEADLPLLARWRAEPHVVEWWGAPEIEPEIQKLTEPRIAIWIVEHAGRPFAFAQDYDVHGWEPHHFSHLPPGSRGIDQYIGEADMLGQGHGAAFIRRHVQQLFAQGVPAVGTDPHPENPRSLRACEKAGFRRVGGPVQTRWGTAILMECWR